MAQKFANAARGLLASGINDSTTTIEIASGGSLFPVANGTDWFNAVLQDETGIEIVRVNTHTSGSNSFTVVRGQEGTTARSFALGSVFGQRVTAGDMEGTTADAVQTLTNKTIAFGSNTLTGVAPLASPALTGTPTAPTAAAGTNTTQLATTAHVFAERTNTATLTNKTLTSPTITGGTLNPTTLQEGSSPAVVQSDIGTAPNEIPLNQYLGDLAYMNRDQFVITPQASVEPNQIGGMAFQLTNNTTLVVKVKGSDGTVRSATLTLA